MTDLYLIAHKVRGESAFDIALQMECPHCHGTLEVETTDHDIACIECDSLGYWWIIPTSGHRAYPYWHCALTGLFEDANIWPQSIDMPPDLPDHYTTHAAPAEAKASGAALLAKLLPKKPFTDRRL